MPQEIPPELHVQDLGKLRDTLVARANDLESRDGSKALTLVEDNFKEQYPDYQPPAPYPPPIEPSIEPSIEPPIGPSIQPPIEPSIEGSFPWGDVPFCFGRV